MQELPFLRSENKSESFCEQLLLARNRIPFLNTGVLFLAGYGESTFLPGKELPSQICQPYWSFQLINSGKLSVKQQGKGAFTLKKGDFFITRPGQTYVFKVIGDELLKKRYVMISHGVLITLLCEQGPAADQTVFPGVDPQMVSQVFDSIMLLALSGGKDMQKKLSGIVYNFLLQILPEERQMELPGDLSRIIADIHGNITERLTVKAMASKYNIGERTLNRLFLKYMNCTPIQYVIRTRMMYAKQMLRSEGLGIENIARVCGYKSFAFFSKEFKRHSGMTPGEYRKNEIISEKKLTEYFLSQQIRILPEKTRSGKKIPSLQKKKGGKNEKRS